MRTALATVLAVSLLALASAIAAPGPVMLTDLKPRWYTTASSSTGTAQGLTFQCPLCRRQRLGVAFTPALDGGPTAAGEKLWQRTGDTFATLTLSPSIDASRVTRIDGETDEAFAARSRPCTEGGASHWHGFITTGELR
jgi:hypothetical protein